MPLLPDSDRTWFSAGATARITQRLSVDLGYSYIHLNSTPVNVTPGNPSFNGVVTYVGTANTHVNVVALAVRYVFDEPSSPPRARRLKH